MSNMEQALYTAIEKLVAENKHDSAVRFTLLVYGIDAGNFLGEDEYIYDVDSRTAGYDLIFYTCDNEGRYSQVWVDLDEGTYRTRIDEEGWGWTNWYGC